jgi:hypothetical protein
MNKSIDDVVYDILYKFECFILSVWFKTNRLYPNYSKIHLFERTYGKNGYFVWDKFYDIHKSHRKIVYKLITRGLTDVVCVRDTYE